MDMSVLLVCIYVNHAHAWCPWGLEEWARSFGIGVMDGCEQSCRRWELNPGSCCKNSKCSYPLDISPAPVPILYKLLAWASLSQ